MKTTDDIAGFNASSGVNVGQSVDTTNASYLAANDSSIMGKNSKFGGKDSGIAGGVLESLRSGPMQSLGPL